MLATLNAILAMAPPICITVGVTYVGTLFMLISGITTGVVGVVFVSFAPATAAAVYYIAALSSKTGAPSTSGDAVLSFSTSTFVSYISSDTDYSPDVDAPVVVLVAVVLISAKI